MSGSMAQTSTHAMLGVFKLHFSAEIIKQTEQNLELMKVQLDNKTGSLIDKLKFTFLNDRLAG